MLKHASFWLLVSAVVFLLGTPVLAIPKAIEIPEALMQGELLTVHRNQIIDRIVWWKKSLLAAKTDSEIQRACQKLLGDYLLYTNRNYREAFAEETIKQCKEVLTGKDIAPDDSLRDLKMLNLSLVLAKMPQPAMEPAYQLMVGSSNEGIRFIGWKGYLAIRPVLLRGTEKNRAPMIAAATQALAKEDNPIILSMVYQVMNLGTVEEKIDVKIRLQADVNFLKAIQNSWPTRRKGVLTLEEGQDELLPALRNGVLALRSIGTDFALQEPKDDKSITLCLQLILDMAYSTAQTFDRAWQNPQANLNLLDQCTNMLQTCEEAMNAIAGDRKSVV
mgnify:FL=1